MDISLKSVFINSVFYKVIWGLSAFFLLAFFLPLVYFFGLMAVGVFLVLLMVDALMLFGGRKEAVIKGYRILPEKFSNGDTNEVTIVLESRFQTDVKVEVIDEVPIQFQKRDFLVKMDLPAGKVKKFSYQLKPVERGDYVFGNINVYVYGRIGFLSRRFKLDGERIVKVYPSFIQMRKYEIMAIGNRLSDVGIKKIRKIGHHTEFDQIRDYIKGDDIRTINWKATARKGHLMVNQYQDEKSQQVFCIVDMGRNMKMPFNGMTLLDYAINTSLVISSIAMLKHDKAGLVTFNEKIRALLPARREGAHIQTIMEVLYKQQTSFLEHNMEALYANIKYRVHQRSLLILFTNFESLKSAQRAIPLLARLAASHLLVVVIFENWEVSQMIHSNSQDIEEIYLQSVAETFIFEKKLIIKELERHGIYAILTRPEKLTVDTMNKYLEFKARGVI